MRHISTIVELLHEMQAKHSNVHALNECINDKWQTLSTSEILREVREIALGLHSIGIKKGDMVGLMAPSSSRWMMIDLAIMSIGAISVPLFANISHENFSFEVNHTNIHIVFIGGEEPWLNFDGYHNLFSKVISLDENIVRTHQIMTLEDLIAKGREVDEKNPELYGILNSRITPDDIATIVFTSGSTGVPKGAIHTHRSLTYLMYTDSTNWGVNDRYLSFLPLAHIFARYINLAMIAWGVSIYFLNDIKNFSSFCKQVKPTILVVVPRILERLQNKIIENVENSHGLKHAIGKWALGLASDEIPVEKRALKDRFFHYIADLLVYRKLRNALGGQIRIVLCGGAALNPHLCSFFHAIGVKIFEGWGQTEACPITSNPLNSVKIGTIGSPIEDLELKVSSDGELLVRGPILMKGYYHNEEATRQAIDDDGWLHTGDKGVIDKDNYVKITGRIKEMFKTSTGEMVIPAPIETALTKSPLIDAAIVIADQRKFLSCLVVPNFEAIQNVKQKLNMTHINDEKFLESDYIKNEMRQLIQHVNEQLNHWEKIREYRFILRPLTIESGELTPSMKVVRSVVEEHYKDLIDSIYQEKGILHETKGSRY